MLNKKEMKKKRREFEIKRMEHYLKELKQTLKLNKLLKMKYRFELWKMAQDERNLRSNQYKSYRNLGLNPLHI